MPRQAPPDADGGPAEPAEGEAGAAPAPAAGLTFSNDFLLVVCLVSFGAFAIAETAGALLWNSRSLLEDAATMLVDSATYGINLVAEHKKRVAGEGSPEALRWEVLAPGFSVFVLIGVSCYIVADAVKAITQPRSAERDSVGEQDSMFAFAGVNLVIDVVNLGFFVRRYGEADAEKEADNLNMVSALTHLVADTCRSIAVFVAAILAMTLNSVSSDRADAWAALAVSFVVAATLVPLLRALAHKSRMLWNATHGGRLLREHDEHSFEGSEAGVHMLAWRGGDPGEAPPQPHEQQWRLSPEEEGGEGHAGPALTPPATPPP
eukprot:TRINITY_DN28765_c0_g1_i1.p1 TRINITY_DN28765_c0_g1~~TRINITY_DN28765_c0_g1_i1.p1  ORF type:complete len:320 (+),score=117.64 TRINITY_DN28765_c0_g1_i1:71-1030(+)